jgi:hypothetical protein
MPEQPDLTQARWAKSTHSNASGDCVEVATNLAADSGVLVRDTKDRGAGAVRVGDFDI